MLNFSANRPQNMKLLLPILFLIGLCMAQPTISIASHSSGTIGATSVIVSGTMDINSTVNVTSNGTLQTVTNSSGTWQSSLNLPQDGNYTITAVAYWPDGNVSAPVSIILNRDLTAPGINTITSENILPTLATISWNTDTPATGRIEYGIESGSYPTSTLEDPSLILNHSFTLSNLKSAAQYFFRVWSCDAVTYGSRNCAVSIEKFLTTQINPVSTPSPIYNNNLPSLVDNPIEQIPTPAPIITPAPTAAAAVNNYAIKTNGQNGQVSATYSSTSTAASLVITYTAPSGGFTGALEENIPLNYSDYLAGRISITPKPTSVRPGSIIATWDVSLGPSEKMLIYVDIDKKANVTTIGRIATTTTLKEPVAQPIAPISPQTALALAVSPMEQLDWGFVIIILTILLLAALIIRENANK